MNYSSAVMLINDKIRAVKAIYENENENPNQPQPVFKTLDSSISVGDLVVVPTDTRHKMTVVKVVEVDSEVDFESPVLIKWIIARVPVEGHDLILSEENKWIEALKASEKRRKREEIKSSMLAMYADDGIEKIGIANISEKNLIENK